MTLFAILPGNADLTATFVDKINQHLSGELNKASSMVDRKLDSLATSVDRKLDSLATSVDRKLNLLGTSVDKLDSMATVNKQDISDLKERVIRVEATLSHVAFKSDLIALAATMIKWVVGTGITLAGVTLAAAKFVN
jgi:phage-related minor tail protein